VHEERPVRLRPHGDAGNCFQRDHDGLGVVGVDAVAGEVGLLQSFGGVTTCYAFLHGQPHTCIVFPVTACMLPHMVHDHNMIHCWNCQRR
jgi:hypothetical protein